MKNFILAAVTLLTVSFAQADDCTLPVCDIPASLEHLKGMNQDGRFNYMKEFRTKYRGEQKPENLRNLNMFAEDTRDLFTSLNDEDWVIRETQYLKNVAITGLIKYDKIEIQYDQSGKNNLMKYFDQINDEGSAYDVLSHWAVNVDKLNEVNQVLGVTNFAEYAKKWAIRTNQEPYVAREADKIIVTGGTNISRLFPAHEGTYSVKATCKPTPKDCGNMAETLAYMSIFDTLGNRGLVINLTDDEVHVPIFAYTTSLLTKAGTHLRGISTDATPNTRVSELNLDLDFKTGKITGVLQDMMYAGEIHIEATPIRRVTQYYTDGGPWRTIEVAEVLGRYKGTMAGIPNCELIVNRYSSGEIVAILDLNGNQTLQFRAGAFNTTNGVLVLTGVSQNMGDRKLVLAYRRDSKEREFLTGFMMNANPKTPEAEFYKVK